MCNRSAIDMSKRLTREERIKTVLISGERSNRVIAADFNARHPTRPPISHATVSKLLAKFRETGSVLDLPKCGRMKTVTNEETSVAVLASFSKSPQRSTRRMSLESGISRTSLRRILATHKWHPYKLQLLQHLNEDDLGALGPPRSPDLTPLDFYLWGHLKAIVYGVKIRDVQHLKLWILEACAGISPAVLLSVCEEWEKRVALTIQHNGQHIEHIL
ncbi:checkpoint HUS1 isoform X5 [Labeo rohita]|uniref:Checkpoint HUS1 isoform X5 n=1 Tax=Labeo rohita TaxID=84645 RepID=A0A498LG52_LABRO|nr:checkpoint HUS1 isoform X5 [Labeo rohita]